MSLLPGPDYFRNNVAFRNDTLLGVCEAIGHDFGFNPNFLRVPLAAGIIFAPVQMVVIYLALGVVAFVSRTFFPDRIEQQPAAAAPVTAPEHGNQEVALPRAA